MGGSIEAEDAAEQESIHRNLHSHLEQGSTFLGYDVISARYWKRTIPGADEGQTALENEQLAFLLPLGIITGILLILLVILSVSKLKKKEDIKRKRRKEDKVKEEKINTNEHLNVETIDTKAYLSAKQIE